MPLFEATGRAPMAYAEAGAKDAPPLLLVHGLGAAASSGFFGAQFDHFSGQRRVVAPDLRGHGGSRRGPAPTISGMADDVEALLEGLDLENVVAVGWSMGATVLWDLLARGKGKRIVGLVTVDMTPRVLNDVTWRFGLADGFDALDSARSMQRMREDWKQYSARIANNALAGDPPPSKLLQFFERGVLDNDPDLMAQAWDSLCAADFRDALARIETPMIVTHGMRSKLYAPTVSAYVAETAPNAVRIPFHRSGHAPHMEEPERFNRLINDFTAILSGQDVRRDMRRLGEHAASQQA